MIIGAGIAGLTAARALTSRGIPVVLIDKGRGVGGRIATRRLSDGQAYDHGALRFTAEDGPVASLASSWESEGLVARVPGQGSPFWNIAGPATRLPKGLAEGLDVETGVRVVALRRLGDGLEANAEDGRSLTASAAIVTCPVPQTLALLDAGGLASEAPESFMEELRQVSYEPALVLLLRVDRRVDGFSEDALLRPQGGGAVSRILENAGAAGAGPSRLSIYARGSFARDAFGWPDADVRAALLDAAACAIPSLRRAAVVESELKRWRFARAESPVAELAPALNPSGVPVVLCGDAFGPLAARSPDGGTDGIARAVLSGLAAAARIPEEPISPAPASGPGRRA